MGGLYLNWAVDPTNLPSKIHVNINYGAVGAGTAIVRITDRNGKFLGRMHGLASGAGYGLGVSGDGTLTYNNRLNNINPPS